MARPRGRHAGAGGQPPQAHRHVRQSSRKGGERNELIWDQRCPHLALSIRTTGIQELERDLSPRWQAAMAQLGDVRYIGLADARRLTARVMLDVIEGKDPVAERRAERDYRYFADLAGHMSNLGEEAQQVLAAGRALVTRHLIPRWGKLKASAITRADVRAMMIRIEAPIGATRSGLGVRDLLMGGEAGDRRRQSLPRRRPQPDQRARAGALRRRDRPAVAAAGSGAETDPADRPKAWRGRRHGEGPCRRGMVADAGQAVEALAGDQERPGSPGRALGAPRRG